MKTREGVQKIFTDNGSKKVFVKIKSLGLVVILILFVCFSLAYGQYTDVASMYIVSMQNPNKTDEFIESNRTAFNQRFFQCLREKRQQAGINGINASRYCDGLPDEQAAQCRLENWAVGVYFWTISIEDAIVNDTPWTDTLAGSAALVAQQQYVFLEQLMPGTIERAKQTTRSIALSLLCD